MRSRKPDTRATMLTWRELSVCATNTGVYGIDFGSTVITLTSGAGRGGGGASLLQPASSARARTADEIAIRTTTSVFQGLRGVASLVTSGGRGSKLPPSARCRLTRCTSRSDCTRRSATCAE